MSAGEVTRGGAMTTLVNGDVTIAHHSRQKMIVGICEVRRLPRPRLPWRLEIVNPMVDSGQGLPASLLIMPKS
jgi:hypothetical protein